MAKQAGLQVNPAVEGIKHLAAFLLGHGVDGQVTAHQIVVQADIGGGMEGKAAIAVTGFAFRAGQGVFLLGFRVQKDGKILSHRAKPFGLHLVGCGTDDDPVSFCHRQSQ